MIHVCVVHIASPSLFWDFDEEEGFESGGNNTRCFAAFVDSKHLNAELFGVFAGNIFAEFGSTAVATIVVASGTFFLGFFLLLLSPGGHDMKI
jgi:hypothetical protein